ncbi:MAG: hypothetical protein FWB72_03195 [Firmicutes bacterium]|nr:hypothetical protein [Bacillota bacterium]
MNTVKRDMVKAPMQCEACRELKKVDTTHNSEFAMEFAEKVELEIASSPKLWQTWHHPVTLNGQHATMTQARSKKQLSEVQITRDNETKKLLRVQKFQDKEREWCYTAGYGFTDFRQTT